MSSAGMDISESFRPEDISKADFFDFVTAPDMGIGLGVNVNLHHSHHNHQQQHHHHHHTNHQHHTQHHAQQQSQSPVTMTQQQHHLNNSTSHTHHASQHQQHHHSSSTDRTMTNDGGGGNGSGSGGNGSIGTSGESHNDASGLSDGSSASTTDPTLHGYEFWSSDKEHTSTIFEDLDRYCWQQQTNATASPNHSSATVMHHSSPANTLNPLHTNTVVNPASPHNHHSPAPPLNSSSSLSSTPVPQTQLNSDGTISNIISPDGQIYTLTVLNGNEPWLKRDTDAHLNSTLDLDSLLGTFPGYIKSEYPYDDSGFSTDGCKDVTTDTANVLNSSSGSSAAAGLGNNQRLPSLLNNISVTSSGAGGGVANASDSVSALSIGQQLDQFHNNNNDWHMTDHNNEQNSAESLLRSALQGKGYAKGLHVHNGIALMPTSPSVKDDEMRRILFPVDADGLNFSDTSLSAAQMFDDAQSANGHNAHLIVPHSPVTNGPLTPVTNNSSSSNNNNNSSNQAASLIVDDMFLTLENAFSDDFEKIKQFCTAGASANDYAANEVMMQISANTNGSTQSTAPSTGSIQAATATHQTMITSLHAPSITATTTTTTPNNMCRQPSSVGGMSSALTTQQQQPPPQPLKPEVTTSTQRIGTTAKVTKKYKRTLTTAHHSNNSSNNNNPNIINHINSNTAHTSKAAANSMALTNGQNRNCNNASSGSSTNSSNSPTHCNGLLGSGSVMGSAGGGGGGLSTNNNSSSSVSGNNSSSTSAAATTAGQRKERSLHYCSICSKGFKDKYSVNVHIRTHTGEKPFACTLCGKSFRQKAHLAKHYQTHMAQKNNGNLVKGTSGKHHRSSNAQNLNTSSSLAAHNHPRSLSLSNTPNTPSSMSANTVGGLVSGILSSSVLPTLGVPVSTSTAPSTPTPILPPANGLLANR